MNSKPEYMKLAVWLGIGALLLPTVLPVTAATTSDVEEWEYGAMIYLWGAGLDAKTQTGGDIDISFSDIVNGLDMAFMGTFEARKGKWSLLADGVYLDISQDGGGSETIPVLEGAVEINRSVDADIKMKASIATFGAGYNVVDTKRGKLDIVGGTRHFWVDVDQKLDLSRNGEILETSRQSKVSDSQSAWDGIAGVRGQFILQDNWYIPYYADIGTGDSQSTWQP